MADKKINKGASKEKYVKPKAAPASTPGYGRAMTVPKNLRVPSLPPRKVDNYGLPGRGGAPGQPASTQQTLAQRKAAGSVRPLTKRYDPLTTMENLDVGIARYVPGLAADFSMFPPLVAASPGIDAGAEAEAQRLEMDYGVRGQGDYDKSQMALAGALGVLPFGLGVVGKGLKGVGKRIADPVAGGIAKLMARYFPPAAAVDAVPSNALTPEAQDVYNFFRKISDDQNNQNMLASVTGRGAVGRSKTFGATTAGRAAAQAGETMNNAALAEERAFLKAERKHVRDTGISARQAAATKAKADAKEKFAARPDQVALRALQAVGLTELPKQFQKLTPAQVKQWKNGDLVIPGVKPAAEIPEIAKAIGIAFGITGTVLASLGVDAIADDMTRVRATNEFQDAEYERKYGESEAKVRRRQAIENFVNERSSTPPPITVTNPAPIVNPALNPASTSTELPDGGYDTGKYIDAKQARDAAAGTTVPYNPETDPDMIAIGRVLDYMSPEERNMFIRQAAEKHAADLRNGVTPEFTEEQMQYLGAYYSAPAPPNSAAGGLGAQGGGGDGPAIAPPVIAPPVNTGVPEPQTWAEQLQRYQDMQNIFNKPQPEPDRTRENELYTLLQQSQQKESAMMQQYIDALIKQLNAQPQPGVGIPAVPAPSTPIGNQFPLSAVSQVGRQGSNLQFSNAGLGYLNSIDPSLLQALMQFLKAQQYTAMGQQGTFGELNYGRAGGIGSLAMSDASFENPLNYAGLTPQMREPAEAGLRSLFAQMGLMG